MQTEWANIFLVLLTAMTVMTNTATFVVIFYYSHKEDNRKQFEHGWTKKNHGWQLILPCIEYAHAVYCNLATFYSFKNDECTASTGPGRDILFDGNLQPVLFTLNHTTTGETAEMVRRRALEDFIQNKANMDRRIETSAALFDSGISSRLNDLIKLTDQLQNNVLRQHRSGGLPEDEVEFHAKLNELANLEQDVIDYFKYHYSI